MKANEKRHWMVLMLLSKCMILCNHS